MIKQEPQVIESENLESLKMPSFRDMYGDIPGLIKEGVDKYFELGVSENNSKANNDAIDADVCLSVIKEFLNKEYDKKILEAIPTTPKGKLFNKLNDKGKIEFEGVLRLTKEEFCAYCVSFYCNKYLGPKILTENYTTKGGHFVIHHTGCLRDETIEALEEILDKNFDRVCKFFKLSKKGERNLVTDVYIFDDLEFYHLSVFGEQKEEWVRGTYSYRVLHMLSPDKDGSKIQTALHEFVHSVSYLNRILREGWTSEGIAEYLTGNKPDEEQLQDVLKKFPLTEENLEKIFSDRDHRDVFFGTGYSGYIYACTAMDYIVKKFGEGKIVEIFRSADKSPFDVLGVSKEEFTEGWSKYVKEGEYIKNLSQDTHEFI